MLQFFIWPGCQVGSRLVGFLPQPGFVISHWQQSPPTCSVLPPCTSYVLVLASIAWGFMCPGGTGPDVEMSWNLLLWDSETLLTWHVRSQQVVERHGPDSWPGLNVGISANLILGTELHYKAGSEIFQHFGQSSESSTSRARDLLGLHDEVIRVW